MKKQLCLSLACLLSACGGGDSATSAPPPTPKPTPTPTATPTPVPSGPNVIFIVADDLNHYVQFLEGHPQAYTPNLNRLAARGINFTNAHANAPICSPSRASFLSGYAPQTSNKYHSTQQFRMHPVLKNAKIMPEHFRDNGYATYLAGKIFHDTDNDNPTFGTNNRATQPVSADDRSGGYVGPQSSFGPYPWDGITRRDGNPYRLIPYGTEGVHWVRRGWGEILLLSGGRWNSNPALPTTTQFWGYGFGRLSQPPTFTQSMNSTYPAGHSYAGFATGSGTFRYRSAQDRSLITDEQIAAWASELIRGIAPSDPRMADTAPIAKRKFMMMLGLTKTHGALYIPDEYYDRIIAQNNIQSIDDVQLAPMLNNQLESSDLADIPADGFGGDGFRHYKHFLTGGREGGVLSDLVHPGSTIPNTEANLLRSLTLSYLAAIYAVDVQVGKILDALDQNPTIRNDTIIVFTSDNGFHFGEKRFYGKPTLWDESTHVPLIIANPTSAFDSTRGQKSNLPVSLIDLYPTLVQMTKLPAVPLASGAPKLDGQSLASYMTTLSATSLQRQSVAITGTNGTGSDSGPIDPTKRNHSIRSENWRYIVSNNGGEELYNLANDPNEWNNLASKSQYSWAKDILRPLLLQRTGQAPAQ